MTWVVPSLQKVAISPFNWVSLSVEVIGDSVTNNAVLDLYGGGAPTGKSIAIKRGDTARFALDVLPSFLTLVGATHDGSRALIALNANISTSAVLRIYSVDESGSGGGIGSGQAHIAGTVKIDGIVVTRDVIVISDDKENGRKVLAEGVSASDGTFDITYSDWTGPVIAVALDNFGAAFTASTALNTDDILHPTVANGFVYVVTSSGTTGETEPTWVTSGAVISGSVTFNPRPYYRPIASGPLLGELIEEEAP